MERIRAYVREGRLEPEELEAAKAEAEAAEARVGLLRDREAEVVSEGSIADANEAVLVYLAWLRAAIAGRVAGSEGLEAVRAALLSTFESFTIHHRDSEAAATKLLDPDLFLVWSPYYLEPTIREEAISRHYEIAYEDGQRIGRVPLPRPMPLPMRGNGDTEGRAT